MLRSLSKDTTADTFTETENKILKLYKDEFSELFHKILNIPSSSFISLLFTRTKLTSSQKFNDFSKEDIAKIEKYITDTYYHTQYKLAHNTAYQIKSLYNNTDKSIEMASLYFNGQNYFKHCKDTDSPIHTCGEKLFINHPLTSLNLNPKKIFVYCMKCNEIYLNDFIQLKCNHCNLDYYSKLFLNKDDKNSHLQLATWAKYHCNAVINDTMKCLKCKEPFYFDPNETEYNCDNLISQNEEKDEKEEKEKKEKHKQKLICLSCGFTAEANLISWKCIFCKKEFESEVKEYNPFTFKTMKIAVKDTLMKNERAIPSENEFKCNCKIDFSSTKFIHKKTCQGEMLLGTLDKKKILVCSLCHSLNFYDSYIWTCPLCERKFQKNDIAGLRGRFGSGILENRIIKYNSQQKNKKENSKLDENDDEDKVKLYRKPSQRNSPIRKNLFLPPTPSGKKDFNGFNAFIPASSSKKMDLNKFLRCNSEIQEEDKENNNISINLNILHFGNGGNKVNKKNLFGLNNDLFIKGNNNNKNNQNEIKKKLLENFNNANSNTNSNIENNLKNNESNINININNSEIKENIPSNSNPNNEESKINSPPHNDIIAKTPCKSKPQPELNPISPPKTQIKINKVTKQKTPKKKKWIDNFNADDYIIKKKIGEGTYGKIYMVTKQGKKYALKKLISTTEEDLKDLTHEYEILKHLSVDKNIDIIDIYGVQTKKLDMTTFAVYILMELATTDWEKEILKRFNHKQYYTESELINIMKCLVKTFSDLQKENVSHRDIKPQNILVCPNNTYKVADFGEAKQLKSRRITARQTIRGTELFMSPILFKAFSNPKLNTTKHNTFKSDVWSLALCFLFAGTLSYDAIDEIRDIDSDLKIEKLVDKYLGSRYSDKFTKFLCRMLKINEKERIDFVEAEKEITAEFY